MLSSCVQWQLLSVFILSLAISGCATTSSKTKNDLMESHVTELEKQLESKDSEITDLQYQVKDLSSRVDSSKMSGTNQAEEASAQPVEAVKTLKTIDSAQIIHVKVSPKKVQKALKAAGVYSGRVDGRIGQGTKAAIIEFQKSHGLKADGVLGAKTWEELKTYLK
jgi:peptidoglycan hydrolase-like protein with peptidoglycan-binding domain